MKAFSIGIAALAFLLAGAFVLTGNKEVPSTVNQANEAVVTEKATETKSAQVYQDYTPPVQKESVSREYTTVVVPTETPNGTPFVPPVPIKKAVTNQAPEPVVAKIVKAVIPPAPVETPKVEIPVQTQSKGALINYSGPADLANLSGTNILFFKASWCITCTMLHDAIVKEKDNIPAGVTIWVVDYDSNEAMRKSYGVTSQHTLVQIDTNKNKINLWRGGFSLTEVLSNIK